jgi:hypothetical protein
LDIGLQKVKMDGITAYNTPISRAINIFYMSAVLGVLIGVDCVYLAAIAMLELQLPSKKNIIIMFLSAIKMNFLGLKRPFLLRPISSQKSFPSHFEKLSFAFGSEPFQAN